MTRRGDTLDVSIGIASETGPRRQNEDFAAAHDRPSAHGILAALADGIGGTKGGRVAAELAVRSFLDDFRALPATLGVHQAAHRIMEATNGWIHAQGRRDPALDGMGSTFAAVVLRGRSAHVLHVGDSRVWRYRRGSLLLLTEDHTLKQPDLGHVLYRAVGVEPTIRLDHRREALDLHDRLLLTSDGVHGTLGTAALGALLGAQTSAEATARTIVDAAIDRGSQDNATAIVLDILALPAPDRAMLAHLFADLPIRPPPKSGDLLDDFQIGDLIANGRYSRLHRARDRRDASDVVLKFPKPGMASDATYHAAFTREAWAAAQVASPHLIRVIEPAPGRQSQLYAVLPFHAGETLEARLQRQGPLSLAAAVQILGPVARAVIRLHRNGIIHRDIKPDNIMLDPVTLIDLGVARIKGQDDDLEADQPGTPSFMAPELFSGGGASEASDIYALGVTFFRLLSGRYPYGEIEPFSRPAFRDPARLTKLRPDLPGWVDTLVARACAIRPDDRFEDASEFLYALEAGPIAAPASTDGFRPLIERDPLRFWQVVAFFLALALAVVLIGRGPTGTPHLPTTAPATSGQRPGS